MRHQFCLIQFKYLIKVKTYYVYFLKNYFRRYSDFSRIEKELLLMALSSLDFIMIKAKLFDFQDSAR